MFLPVSFLVYYKDEPAQTILNGYTKWEKGDDDYDWRPTISMDDKEIIKEQMSVFLNRYFSSMNHSFSIKMSEVQGIAYRKNPEEFEKLVHQIFASQREKLFKNINEYKFEFID